MPPPPIVLLVDTHEDSRLIYGAALRHHGLEVLACAAPQQALALARDSSPSVVVLELTVAAGAEWELVPALRGDGGTASIPVLALSSTGLPEHRERALALGCSAFLVKPLPPLELLAEIRRVTGTGPS